LVAELHSGRARGFKGGVSALTMPD
jgi:hypothetical protein